MSKLTNTRWRNIASLVVPAYLFMEQAGAVNVNVDADVEKFEISPYITASSQVHVWGKDSILTNTSINLSGWHYDNNILTMRYPAGQAHGWNWENPSGLMGDYILDPDWSGNYAAAEDWMDIDEYLDFCTAAGITEVTMGVNYAGHRMWSDFSKSDSLGLAQRQIEHVTNAGFYGGFWYIGNEDMGEAGGLNNDADGAPQNFVDHVQVLKSVDPTIMTFWNDNHLSPSRLSTFLGTAGTWADGAEFHDKWPAGGKWWEDQLRDPVPLSLWLNEVPLIQHKHGEVTYRDRVQELRDEAAALGRPNFLIMNNEYGLNGTPAMYDSSWDRYTKSLVCVELRQEMIICGLDMSALWDNMDGGDHKMINSNPGKLKANPMMLGFELMNDAPGSMMSGLTTDNPFVHGFTSKDETSIYVHLLNKTTNSQPITVTVSGFAVDQNPDATALVEYGNNHWGKHQSVAITYDAGSGQFTGTLPSLSYSRIIFARDKGGDFAAPTAPIDVSAKGAGGLAIELNWSDNTEPDLDEYRVYRATEPGGIYRLLASNISDSHYIDTDRLVDGVNYYYLVQAVDTADNHSHDSAEVYSTAAISTGADFLGWDAGEAGSANYYPSGVDGTLVVANSADGANAMDGTWGGQIQTPSPRVSGSSLRVVNDEVVTITIDNNTGTRLRLDGLFFDYNRVFSGSPRDVTVVCSGGDLDVATPVILYSALGHATGEWLDHDVSFDGMLSDRVLADGESASFTITVSGATGGGGGDLDNIMLLLGSDFVNTAPAFTADPVSTSGATEDAAYSDTIAGSAMDVDSDPLTYNRVAGPAWLSVASDGALAGTPLNADVGLNSWTIRVSDGLDSDYATLELTVANVNDAPTFTADPIGKPNAVEDEVYTDTLVGSVVDEDAGDMLTYSKVSGPAWLSVSANGNLSGTPGAGDVGANVFTVQVDDGNGGSDTATLHVTVDAAVNLPPYWVEDPFTNNDATEDVAYTNGWIKFRTTDPEGDVRTFAKVSGPAWAGVDASSGQVLGTPTQSDVGTNTFVVSVSDGVNPPVEATMHVYVIDVNAAPYWAEDPFTVSDATEISAYTTYLKWRTTDPDNDTRTFAKVSGPAWADVDAAGVVTGTPTAGDIGTNTFVVSVSDGVHPPVEATMLINVDPLPWTQLTSDDFEAGWGNWVDGGNDAMLSSNFAVGSQCLNLQDDTSSAKSALANSLDLTGYTELKIEFSYVVQSFENSEYFRVRYSSNGGTTFTQFKAYVNDVDFVDDGTRYMEEIILDSASHTFSDAIKIEFQCEASGDGDDVYIDDIVISAR